MFNKNNLVYCITNIVNGKRYVGQTTRGLKQRWSDHLSYMKNNDQRHLYCAMRKYGAEKFVMKPLVYCELFDLDYYEIAFIAKWDLMNHKVGYCNESGGNKNKKLSEETKEKQRLAKIGKYDGEKNPMYGRTGEQSPAYGRTGDKHPMYGRTGNQSVWFGKHHTKDSKQKMRKSRLGKYVGENSPIFGIKRSEETIQKCRDAKPKKPVIGFSIIDGSSLYFGSTREARRSGYKGIVQCLSGKCKTCKNHIVRYATPEEIEFYTKTPTINIIE